MITMRVRNGFVTLDQANLGTVHSALTYPLPLEMNV